MYRLFIFTAIFTLFSGCDSGTGAAPAYWAPIDSKIQFTFAEEIVPGGRNTTLLFVTDHIYTSGGYKIIGTVVRNGNWIAIKLTGISVPETGPDIMAPATFSYEFGALPKSSHSIDFNVNGEHTLASLDITDSAYTVTIPMNRFLYTTDPKLLRVPRNAIWGWVEAFTPEPCRLFLDSLESFGAEDVRLPAGNYTYFTIDRFGSPTVMNQFGRHYGEDFLYLFMGDTALAHGLVRRFARRYQDTIYIQLRGGRGELFDSWYDR